MTEIFQFFAFHAGRILAIAVAHCGIASLLYVLHLSHPRIRVVPMLVSAVVWLAWAGWESLISPEDYMRVDLLVILPAAVLSTLVCSIASWKWLG